MSARTYSEDEWDDLGTTDPEDFLDMADNRRDETR